MNQILNTARLSLRELTFEDTKFIIELVNSPGWIKFIGDRNIKTDSQAKKYLENGPMKSYKDNGFGLWLVSTKEGNIPIGMCGLIKRDNLENPDLGFAFLPAYIGKGYGFEIATATMTYALDNLYLKTILAITVPYNATCIKLMEKLGMTFQKSFQAIDDQEELMLFSN